MRTKDSGKMQRIKDAMVALILKEGIEGVSIAKIAKAAGVSPGTIYVYYQNKEEMLKEVFDECTKDSYSYVAGKIYPEMSGKQLIEELIMGIYSYALHNEETFSFVEQCSCCPTLSKSVRHSECSSGIFDLIHEYQRAGIIKTYSDLSMAAVLFSPVKFLAVNASTASQAQEGLTELIAMLQELLLY